MYASKLVYTPNNYTQIAAQAQAGIMVRNKYYLGLEEWNNNEILKSMRLAYLNYILHQAGTIDKIALIMYNPNDSKIYQVGNIFGAVQLRSSEIESIRENLGQRNWLYFIEDDFRNIGDGRHIHQHKEYMKCWDSDRIVTKSNKCFILNLRYNEIKFFTPSEIINLSRAIPIVNIRWKRLSGLYKIPAEWISEFNIDNGQFIQQL